MTISPDAPFSYATRERNIASMVTDPVDLLVIGGGITGTAIARDAAMRGIRTAIVDSGDFGGGTSGRSSRLVNGGFRYLELGRFGLVYLSCRERRKLLYIAPHLIRPLPFIFPVYRSGRISLGKLATALLLYDSLALFRNVRRHRLLGKQSLLKLEPSLRSQDLRGGGLYWEASCNDARLTLATVRSAFLHGALVANYAGVDELDLANGRIYGARITDRIAQTTYTVRAHTVLNAAGPWADTVRRLGAGPGAGDPLVQGTRGSHVVLPRHRLGIDHAVTMTSPIDGRIIFAIPSADLCYLGTTDDEHEVDPERTGATAEDVVYLLRSTNAYFPGARLAPEDVVSTWSGVRPLVPDPSASAPGGRSREHRITEDPTGLISIVGGKLTTHRSMAAEAVNRVAEHLHQRDGRRLPAPAATAAEPLPGGEVQDLDVLISDLIRQGFGRETAAHLVASYGTESAAIARIVESDPIWGMPLVGSHPAIRAEVVHCVRREMAMTLSDIMMRRIGLFFEVVGHAVPEAPNIVDMAGDELGWSAPRKAAELATYLEAIQHSMSFRDDLPG